MSKRLNKKLRKNNKVVEKDLFASNADIEFENYMKKELYGE